ncbi:MAG: hypothetical protein ACOCU6_00835 [Nanoarchaeota archaeon]
MKSKTMLVGMLAITVVLFMAGCSVTGDVIGNSTSKDPVTLGHCPTMADLAKEIASKNEHVSLVRYGSTAKALDELDNGSVDVVLVGRLAHQSEVNDGFEKRLEEGLTLVGTEKKLMRMSDIKRSKVHTAVSEDLTGEYLPNANNIVFHDSTDSAIQKGLNDIVLIDWNDYTDDMELVIPVDMAGNKIERFRIPVLYSTDEDYIKQLEA